MRVARGKVPQIGKFAMDFRGDGGHFVAQTKIQRQVGLPAPVVLNISAEQGLSKVAGGKRAGNSALKPLGNILQEGALNEVACRVKLPQGSKLPVSAWI